jgi:hypothetical protein
MTSIDPEVRRLAEEFVTRVGTGRAVAAVRVMLEKGYVTTDDISEMGYNHPPRAIADVRDNGIPVVTEQDRSPGGKRRARYRFGTAQEIREGQIGRTNFSKKFRKRLFEVYGPVDCITMAEHDPRSLQIDHRVPYRIAGDAGLETDDVKAYMLLDRKSQRAKSFSCENCRNFTEILDPIICKSCFWAFPENYSHVAMQNTKRADVIWQGEEVEDYIRLERSAAEAGISVQDLLKRLARTVL